MTDAYSSDFYFMADALPQIMWTAMPDGRIDYYNKRWEEYTGFTGEETRRIGWENALHPDDVEPTKKVWESARRKGLPLQGEYRLRRASDNSYRWFLVQAVPIRKPDGTIDKWFGTSTDINDQKKATAILEQKVAERTAKLADNERKLRALFDYAYQLIGLYDVNGRTIEINKTCLQFFGVKAEDVVGKLIWDLPWFLDDREMQERIRVGILAAAQGEFVRMVNTHVSEDGDVSVMDGSLKPIFDDEGKVKWILAEGHDMTEAHRNANALLQQAEQLKKATDKLFLSNQDLRQFAYVASHDLQEPLRTVISFSGLLKKHCADKLDEDEQKYLATIVAATARMQQLIKDLLTYSQVETQGKKLLPVQLKASVDLAIAALNSAISESGAKITVGELPLVLADSVQLSVVFQNLLANAIKFRARERPEITVKAEETEDFWRIKVSDNGIGIKMEYASKIFVIFQRLHARDDYPGTGIGLAVCKRIVERHNGTIFLEASEGQGSTFVIVLPKIK